MFDEIRRHSRWLIRVMEWDEPRARYPNLWHDGMPARLYVFDRVAARMRLGDLVAAWHPASQRHPERAERFVGLSRVVSLSLDRAEGFAWIDLATEHRFEPPLDLGVAPRRVVLCCDPGWPEAEVRLFDRVVEAAVAAGWTPRETDVTDWAGPTESPASDATSETPMRVADAATAVPTPGPVRIFAGVDYSGDLHDSRDRTWLALVELRGDRLRVGRLEPTGRGGLQASLRDPDRALMSAEAIGLAFPFGLPERFAERLLGGSFSDEGWWALVHRIEHMAKPDYLTELHAFRDGEGELRRLTDERHQAPSPLRREAPDLGARTVHGLRMIAEDRSRFAVRPFESAQGKLLLEVNPTLAARRLLGGDDRDGNGERPRVEEIVRALVGASLLPIDVDARALHLCRSSRDALDALLAARCAALAVVTGEADRSPDDLAPGEAQRVRREGWIYGLA